MSKPNNNNNKKKTQWRVKSDQKEPNIDIVNLADKIDLLVNKVQSLEKEIKKTNNTKKVHEKKKIDDDPIISMTFGLDDPTQNPLNLLLGPLLGNNAVKKPAPKVNNIETSEEEEFEEYDSSDEFEDLNVEINNIDDLINLGKQFEPFVKLQQKSKPPTIDPKFESLKRKINDEKTKGQEGFRFNLVEIPIDTNSKNGSFNFSSLFSKPPVQHIEKKLPKQKTKKVYTLNGKKYSINLEVLVKLITPLNKLKSMIGLDNVKNSIVEMIMYYLQSFETKNNNMLHTVIEGPPGVGKTQLGKILAEIYAALGVIPSSKFKLVKRADLVGEYVGHTAPKTQKVIDEADGGVLFIDEAYSLGNQDKKDSFSKECIDTLNQNLSENKKKLIVIIAGYPDELDKCFFSMNPGLKRRFPFKFTIDGYSSVEMKNIFLKKVADIKWSIDASVTTEELNKLFVNNKTTFPHYGGDIETFILKCKFAHSKRMFGKHPKDKCKLNQQDLTIGLERFMQNKKSKDAIPEHLRMFYGC